MAIQTREAAREALIDIERLAQEVREWVLDQYDETTGERRERLLGLSNKCRNLAEAASSCYDVLEQDEDDDQ